jgi:putative membrane protein
MEKRLLKTTMLIAACAAMAALPVKAQVNNDTGLSSGTSAPRSKADSKVTKFIKEAAEGNDSEVAMAEIGYNKAQSPEVKSLCQQLKQDHMKANEDLKPIAQKYGVSIDQPLKHKAQRETSKFEKESSGQKFDQAFAIEQLKDHQKDIKKYQQAIQEFQQTPDVQQYAQTTLPVLEQHLQHAAQAARAVGVDQSTIAKYTKNMPASVGGTSESSSSDTTKGAGARDLQNGSSFNNGAQPPQQNR